MKNNLKYLSYKEAWRRIKSATDSEYYFEVVTLCESIIADRLLSYIQGTSRDTKVSRYTSFSRLICKWRKLAKSLPEHKGADLGDAVDAWRKERNKIVHGLVKSDPGKGTDNIRDFLECAENAARDGAKLARDVSNWHKRQLAGYRAQRLLGQTGNVARR